MKYYRNYKSLSTLLLLILPIITTFAQLKNQVTIHGSISNNVFTTATLYLIGQDVTETSKSVVSQSGEFSITQEIAHADFYKLEFDKNNFIMMVLKPGETVEIKTDAKDFLKQLQIRGSEETMHIFANQRIIDETKFKQDSISNLSYQFMADPKFDSITKVFKSEFDKIENAKIKSLQNFMLTHTTSLANLFLPEAFPIDNNIHSYIMLDTALFAKYPDNFYVNNLHSQIAAARKTIIGSLAPDFTLPDTSGLNVTLSSLRGKIVLIDFWASWCGPCMKEMPNVIKLYADFRSKGFEIMGVSLDKSRPSWLNAIKTKNLSWIQVSDVKYWQSMVVPLYNVSAIPYTVLIDKDGKIIAKNLRGEELYNKVKELLK
jgi:peroxiredoxin